MTLNFTPEKVHSFINSIKEDRDVIDADVYVTDTFLDQLEDTMLRQTA